MGRDIARTATEYVLVTGTSSSEASKAVNSDTVLFTSEHITAE